MNDQTTYLSLCFASIVVEAGPDQGLRRCLQDGETLVVGRATECDILVNDAKASRRHASLRLEGEQLVVVDLGSSNGLVLDGQPVREGVARAGCRILIGDNVFHVEAIQSPRAAQAQRQQLAPRQLTPRPAKAQRPRILYLAAGLCVCIAFGVWVAKSLVSGPAEPQPSSNAGTPSPSVAATPPPATTSAGQAAAAERFRSGMFFYDSGKLKRAWEEMRQASRLDPENAALRNWLVRVETELDQQIDQHYRQALLDLKYQRKAEALRKFHIVMELSMHPDDPRRKNAQQQAQNLEGK